MKILITGSGGFIGTALMKAMKKTNHKILGIDKKYGISLVNSDIFFKTVFKTLEKPDLIIHLAAQTSTKKSLDTPNLDFSDNVIGTFNVYELARICGAKVIYVSSRKVVPNAKGSRAPYGLSKYIGELYLQEYGLDYGIKYLINRLGNVYGPGQEGSDEAFWLAWFIKASIKKLPITIYGFGGKQSRDMLYIDDCIDLLMDQVKHFQKYRAVARGKVFEVGGGPENEISLLEALKILKYKNYNLGEKLAGDKKREVYDNKLISSVKGWKPKVPLNIGIEKTIEHYKKSLKKGVTK